MGYEEIVELCGQLSYRDKFRLAQLLIQLARKEEELKFPVFNYATSRITAAIRGFCVGLLAPPQSLPKPSPP
ncbi:hypothetical protein, partial [uncultured Lamprocystis sp.]|uniref:hypothetical protein n=1 Tax=uncultured Lamprocystis sp. TaxID=543132 RepID=UPI0025EDCB9D